MRRPVTRVQQPHPSNLLARQRLNSVAASVSTETPYQACFLRCNSLLRSYSKFVSPNTWNHGFIYNNGQWATLNYPDSTLQTTLSGISNANLIVGTTIKGSTTTGSFLYQNGTFKKIVMPNSNVPTYAYGVSLGRGLITGFSGYTGFIASCK
jgi:hypothetical protein